MSNTIKFFVNNSVVYSENSETQLVFFIKRPSVNEKGEPLIIVEE